MPDTQIKDDVIQNAPKFLTELPKSVYEADLALADALEKWKKHRLITRLAKAATYKESRNRGDSQVDAQARAREVNKALSEEEISLEADYYRHRSERDYLANKLMTVRQLNKFHEADQG